MIIGTSGPDLSRPRHRWTVEDYHRMAQAGLLGPDCRVELIDGEVVEMAPIGSRHGGKVNRLLHLLSRLMGDTAVVSAQNPVILGSHDELQPDIALLRWRKDFYETAHPTVADVLLLVEVSDSTLGYDRGVKLSRYALHGVPQVWIVNLRDRCLEVYRNPGPEGYREAGVHRRGRIDLPGVAGPSMALAELFPE
ncbi:MAG: Uma2 family endonuclease [Candidatus Competibacteraceae bacterium]|nr:Uma2 family endonuclease [Candidatus Competibacteraceae bacterium]